MAKRVIVYTTVTATVKEQWTLVVPDDFNVTVDNAMDLISTEGFGPSVITDVENIEVTDEVDRDLHSIDTREEPASESETRLLTRAMRLHRKD